MDAPGCKAHFPNNNHCKCRFPCALLHRNSLHNHREQAPSKFKLVHNWVSSRETHRIAQILLLLFGFCHFFRIYEEKLYNTVSLLSFAYIYGCTLRLFSSFRCRIDWAINRGMERQKPAQTLEEPIAKGSSPLKRKQWFQWTRRGKAHCALFLPEHKHETRATLPFSAKDFRSPSQVAFKPVAVVLRSIMKVPKDAEGASAFWAPPPTLSLYLPIGFEVVVAGILKRRLAKEAYNSTKIIELRRGSLH